MLAHIVRRLLQGLVVMLAVGLVSFSLISFVGDPVASLLGLDTPQEAREELKEELGLNDPFVVRYGAFLLRAAQGDLGLSYTSSRPVVEVIAERLPATIELTVVSAVLAIVLAIPMGVYTALHRETWGARLLLTASLVGVSLPTFVIGIMLILVFSVSLGWLPSFGRGELVRIGWWTTGLASISGWKSILMPAASLALVQMTFTMRLVRAEMLEGLRTDYIRFARARGLTNRAVHFRHALKNTLVPVVTVIGLQVGTLLAFAIVTETVFQWPGMGLLFIQSVSTVDVPVMTAFLMVVGLIFVVVNLAVDLLYLAIDPRLHVTQ
ncbi:MAG: ABC transporter permease [Immundisolibacterales bacterium]|nr:ABC transporter permease [Immundisolibacterales bacterium]